MTIQKIELHKIEVILFWNLYLGANKDREYNRWTRKCGSVSYCP